MRCLLPDRADIRTGGGVILTADELMARAKVRLAREALHEPHGTHGDDRLFGLGKAPERDDFIPAAVLILADRATDSIILTRRSDLLRKHRGQVAFPGGRIDPGDSNAIAAALREADEEIGLAPASCMLGGILPEYFTGTGYRVTPVIAIIDHQPPWRINPAEVAEVFAVPIAILLDPSCHATETREIAGETRSFYAIHHEGHYIWGVTAGIIRLLLETLS
jgi:8-oxo-dGTP pyrophosphatase MutT (NUDIX family)